MPTETAGRPSSVGRLEDLVKTYRTASGEVRALQGVSADLPAAAVLAVVGPSGSGKSSLLRLIAGLDRPTSGSLVVEGTALQTASMRELRRFRRASVGYLFQRPSDNFLPHLTVGEHLRAARALTHRPPRIDPTELLATLGIGHRVDHLPSELSGGEQQRAAIAEVLTGGAGIVVADEPTAELDTASATQVLGTIRGLVDAGVTFVIATHDRSVMRQADEVLELDHGVRRGTRTPAERSGGGLPGDAGRRPGLATPEAIADEPLLRAIALVKSYRRGEETVHALDGVELWLRPGELVGLVGRSGSGKTTLLNVIAGWERPDAGLVERLGSTGIPDWSELSVVPQRLGLLEELTVRENIEYPARLASRLADLLGRVEQLMEDLAIGHLEHRYPRETSLGEQQRTAVARALVLSPALVLADEPTGHQDAVSERRVLDAFRRSADFGGACLIATHNSALAPRLDRVLSMADGRLDGSAGQR